MTADTLADIALPFAREVRGLKQAKLDSCDHHVIVGKLPSHNHKAMKDASPFHYTDLNAVMDAVRSWCKAHDMTIFQKISGDQIGTSIQWGGFSRLPEPGTFFWATDPCHALMSACLVASRKMKGEV